ncbi:GGDEF domain-containing protein [Marinomonas sp.]|uniref:GGDEF domain-containing protein n=1 Tax=Marinomonas sp. TaxID=1904862 RepID=UPI003BAC0CBD
MFLGLSIEAVLYFQQQSKPLLAANFTALVIDIMQAQEDVHRLKRSLAYLRADSPFFDINELEKTALSIRYRLPVISGKIGESRLDDIEYKSYIKILEDVSQTLPEFRKRIQDVKASADKKADLIPFLDTLELKMAVSITELRNIVQDASSIERRLKNQLKYLIWGLIGTILLAFSALLVVLIRLYRIKEVLTIQNNLDHLTQLPNRRFITEKTQKILLTRPSQIGLAIIDLDLFKKINDLYGHPAGDEVLKVIADIFAKNISIPSSVARLGGEEFCILFLEKSQQEVLQICEDIRETVEQTKIKVNNSTLIHLTLSIGLYYHEGERQTTFSQIYNYADQALYLAKKEGRNRLVMHETSKA